MKVDMVQEKNVMVVRPEEELADPSQFLATLESFNSSGLKAIALDLLEKEWLSSSEIGVVMWIYKELEKTGSELCLLVTSPFVLKTIKLTGIDQLLPIFTSLQEVVIEQ